MKLRETKDKMDYVMVVNRHLDRVAEVRSRVYLEKIKKYHTSNYDAWRENVLDYLGTVEALYSLLLPSLRGNAGQLLAKARKLLMTIDDLLDIVLYMDGRYEVVRKLPWIQKLRESGQLETTKENLEREYNNLLNEIPKEYKNKLGSAVQPLDHVVAFIDLALEEMLKRLDKAGLLLSGKSVSLGVIGK